MEFNPITLDSLVEGIKSKTIVCDDAEICRLDDRQVVIVRNKPSFYYEVNGNYNAVGALCTVNA